MKFDIIFDKAQTSVVAHSEYKPFLHVDVQ